MKRIIGEGFLPDVAVQEQQSYGSVQIMPGQTNRNPVQIGVTKDTVVAVFDNLDTGDPILLKASGEVKEGTKIER